MVYADEALERELAAARRILRDHPLSRHFDAQRVEQWLADTARVDPLRVAWHATRTLGFGGSEVGTLVANRNDRPGDFGESARHVIERKLLLAPVRRPNPSQLRGIDLETLIRQRTQSAYGACTDDGALRAIAEGRGPLPYMRYSPDDVWQLAGERLLVDYKSPTTVELLPNGAGKVAPGYGAQLHAGRLVAAECGVRIDRMLLVQWDYVQWCPVVTEVEHEPALDEQIVEACKFYREQFWEKGLLPPAFERPLFDVERLSPPTAMRLAECGQRFALLQAASKRFAAAAAAERTTVESLVAGFQVRTKSRLTLPDLNVDMTPSFDAPAARAALAAGGLTTDAIDDAVRVPETIKGRRGHPETAATFLDPLKVEAALAAAGIDPATVRSPVLIDDPQRLRAFCDGRGLDPTQFERLDLRFTIAPELAARLTPASIAGLLPTAASASTSRDAAERDPAAEAPRARMTA